MRLTILGCGASGGVPVPGLGWGECDPDEPRNHRRRPSLLVEHGGTTLLVDTSPDCREQLLDADVRRLDGVLFTHAHADHSHGIDDLRWINMAMDDDLPVHLDGPTLSELRRRFGYAFEPLEPRTASAAHRYYYKPVLVPRRIDGRFAIGGIDIVPFVQDHGHSQSLGFRLGQAAYSTDVVALDDNAFAILAGIEVWIVDCMRREPHTTHSHLAQTLDWIDRVRPKRAVLTHMGPTLDYATLKAELPPNVEPGFDGMVIDLDA